METGYSVVTELPSGYKPDFGYFLFAESRHLALQSESWNHFYLLRKSNHKVMAQLALHLGDQIARSPVRAPFGSFSFSGQVQPQVLLDFIQAIERALIEQGIATIRLTEPPSVYRSRAALLHAILLNQGYRVSRAELSSCIRIDRMAFEDKIEKWERRKFKQAKKSGLVFRLLKLDNLREVYDLILKCREQRKQSLSMTFGELETTAHAFRSRFVLSAAYLNREMTAASIAILVDERILYNFYSGHLKKYDSLSPVVTLMGGLYAYCAKQNVQLLDLGTSSVDGQLNFSLLDFKLRLGAEPSIKLSFEKRIA